MNNDRELLELAAKAAGIEYGADRIDSGLSLTEKDGRHRSLPRWNPLEDDGDALRLAVRLRLTLGAEPSAFTARRYGKCSRVVFQDDQYSESSMRRAIVCAAANIGRQMTSEERGATTWPNE